MDTLLFGTYDHNVTNYFYTFLRPIDKLCLSKTCTSLRKYYPDINSEIRKRFSFMKDIEYQSFLLLLGVKKAIVSGSILLQILYGESWENSDIDIFFIKTDDNDFTVFDQFFYIIGLRPILIDNYKDKNHETMRAKPPYNSQRRKKCNYEVVPYESIKYGDYEKGVVINIIAVKPDIVPIKTAKEAVLKTFDYDCLVNTWDGSHLQINNFDDVCHKKLHLLNDPYTIFNMVKEKTSVDDYLLENSPDVIQQQIYYRLQKYLDRGFTV